MKSLTKIIAIVILSFFTTFGFTQMNRNVSITSIGSGNTLNDAKQAALRSAKEQVFVAFISSKSEIFEDQKRFDSGGYIKSYIVLNESQLPDKRWAATIKAIISIDKLNSYVKTKLKGSDLEIKSDIFSFNLKQQLLTEQSEINAINEMVGILHETMQISFDYKIMISKPKSLDADNKKWAIPLEVKVTSNNNFIFCVNYCIKTLKALSLSTDDVKNYESLNKAVFPVFINYDGVHKTFYLRKQSSIDAINTQNINWDFYTRLFTVQSGLDEINGNSLNFGLIADRNGTLNAGYIDFRSVSNYYGATDRADLSAGQIMETFSWQDERTLSQTKQMNGYKVKPRGVVSQFKHGGFVIFEENGHGLVIAASDLDISKNMNWSSAKIACEELVLNGYSDWRLPTKEEFNIIYVNMKKFKVGNLGGLYWSSSECDSINAWVLDFYDIKLKKWNKNFSSGVRAVRAF